MLTALTLPIIAPFVVIVALNAKRAIWGDA
jgi:hypothetical protein